MEIVWDMVIIGSGPAGLTAAIYGVRGNVSVLVLEGPEPGGQLLYTQQVENYPGKIDTGYGLINSMKEQAANLGAVFADDIAESVTLNQQSETDIFKIICPKRYIYAKSVIIATGSSAKWLNLPNEEKFKGDYISTCATCDGFTHKGKNVAVVGGGNTAVEDAIYLANMCNKVTLIHRKDTLRAEKIMQKRLFELKNIEFKWNREIIEYIGNERLTALKLKSTNEHQNEEIEVDALFIAIGHTPNTALVSDLLQTDEFGYLPGPQTNIRGLFTAGDIMDKTDKQAITAAGFGCMAARRALHFLYMR